MKKSVVIICVLLCISSFSLALDNGLGILPPMGWSSWFAFGPNITEAIILDNANALARNNLHSLGYEYVIIGHGWASPIRSNQQELVPDSARFPNGIQRIAELVHTLGLKLGITASAGHKTCVDTPGSFGFERIDAQTFASWGIDYVKYDSCGMTDDMNTWQTFSTMRDALNATGKPIYYSVNVLNPFNNINCNCEPNKAYTTLPWLRDDLNPRDLANDWLVGYCEINDSWGYDHYCDGKSMSGHINGFLQLSRPSLSDPGAWNNMDLMTMCNGNMSLQEYKQQFSLWAVHQSPMILSVDLTNFNKTTQVRAANGSFKTRSLFGPDGCQDLLVNEEVIEVNQDKHLDQGALKYVGDYFEIYVKPLADRGVALVMLNKSVFDVSYYANFQPLLGIPKDVQCNVRDLWGRKNIGFKKGGMQLSVKARDVLMYKISPAL